jgi:hypothetical protein
MTQQAKRFGRWIWALLAVSIIAIGANEARAGMVRVNASDNCQEDQCMEGADPNACGNCCRGLGEDREGGICFGYACVCY